jgi:hypothetical protein
MLNRARAHSREIAVRLAVGAAQGRLVRQFVDRKPGDGGRGRDIGPAGGPSQRGSVFPVPHPGRRSSRIACAAGPVYARGLGSERPSVWFDSRAPDEQCGTRAGVEVRANRRRETASALRAERAGRRAGSRLAGARFAAQASRTGARLLSGPAGFRVDHLLIASLDPALARYTPGQTSVFYRRP